MAKGTGAQGKFRGKANASLREPSPWGVTHAGLNSSGNERPVHMRGGVVYQLIRDSAHQRPVFTGADHASTLCLACPQIPDSRKKSGGSAQDTLLAQTVQTQQAALTS